MTRSLLRRRRANIFVWFHMLILSSCVINHPPRFMRQRQHGQHRTVSQSGIRQAGRRSSSRSSLKASLLHYCLASNVATCWDLLWLQCQNKSNNNVMNMTKASSFNFSPGFSFSSGSGSGSDSSIGLSINSSCSSIEKCFCLICDGKLLLGESERRRKEGKGRHITYVCVRVCVLYLCLCCGCSLASFR